MKDGHYIEIHHPTGLDHNYFFKVVVPHLGCVVSSHFLDYSTCNTALQEFKERCKDKKNWVVAQSIRSTDDAPFGEDVYVARITLSKYRRSRHPEHTSSASTDFGLKAYKDLKMLVAFLGLMIDDMPLRIVNG